MAIKLKSKLAFLAKVSGSEAERLIQTVPVVVVDFTATWCPPCNRLKKIFTKFLAPLLVARTDIAVISVDADAAECQAFYETYKVTSMPTFLIFRDGKRSKFVTAAGKAASVNKIVGGSDETVRSLFLSLDLPMPVGADAFEE